MNIRRYFVLALLTFFLVATVLPVAAHQPSTSEGATRETLNPEDRSSGIGTFQETSLLDRGRQLYEAGRLSEAAQVWRLAAQQAEQGGKAGDRVSSDTYLAIVYQDLGEWDAARDAIARAETLAQALDDPILYARVLNTRGSLELNTGNAEAAISTWEQAEERYRSLSDIAGIAISQINQAQALQTLGLYRRAQQTLERLERDLAALPDSLLKARGLSSLGATLQVVGDLQQSEAVLSQSLAIAHQFNSAADIGEILFRLGNTARARSNFQAALQFYQQAGAIATHPRTQLEAALNQLSLLVNAEQPDVARSLLQTLQKRLAELPVSRWGVYARVNLAESWLKIGNGENWEIAQILATAVQHARELRDPKAEAYALGELGHLYERTNQWSEALKLTQIAIALAQEMRVADLAAPWYWQEGRILSAQGDTIGAIAAYEQAVATLELLRQDLVAVNPDVQFSFREQVEPVYRQLVQLLLQNVDNLPETTRQQHLQRSREVIEALQLAELENFFREACLTYKPRPIDEIDLKAAAIYPILLDRRLEVILSVPGEPLHHYGVDLSPQEADRVFQNLRQSLSLAFLPSEGLIPAQKLYDWLVRPAQAALERQQISTLVFVLDGFLRNLPMAVLHDGKHYLIEKYNIALSPGLQLLESQRSLPNNLNTLVGGLTEARQGFSALPGVTTELEEIQETLPTRVLLNETFTRSAFQEQVEAVPFSVVHLATHAQFSSNAEDTFILTWEGRINVKDLDRLLRGKRDRDPIELLVLSACQTAKGDERATLGLAGVAVRSGARSTLATLWSVQDQSTAQLMTEFYRRLVQPGTTKAEALRQAQLSLLHSVEYQHPYYWAAFVAIGNWL